MSQHPESSGPVLKLYAIELPDGSIAMSGPYVLATENEGQAGRMAHARDGQKIAFVRELQQAQVAGEKPSAAWQQAYKEIAATPLSEIKGDLYQAVKKRSEEIEAATPQSSAPVVGESLSRQGGDMSKNPENLDTSAERVYGIDTSQVEYDRKLIAKMLDELEPVVGLQYIRESVANQARLLRAAADREAAGVHTGRASEAGDCPDGFMLVRKEAIDWLNGESDFECPPDRYFCGQPPRYWWRSVFREKAGLAIAAAPAPGGG